MPKRILHFRGSSALLGAERVILELCQWSSHFGYEPLIAAPNRSTAPVPEFIAAARADGIDARTLPCDGRFDPGLLRHLRELVRSEGIDLIHCHGYKEDFYAALAGLDIPLISTNHLWKRTTPALRVYCWLDGLILRRFDQVIAVSDPIMAELEAAAVPPGKLAKIPNGIDIRRFDKPLTDSERLTVRESLGLRPDGFVVGMLGSLTPEKGHAVAIEAMAALAKEFPALQLCIVGDGPLRQSLRARSAALGLERHIVFAGRRSDIAQVVGAFDSFLLPSLNEGLPMALLEAMAAGLPTIASEVGDVGSVIENGASGLLVPAGSSIALTQALRALAGDPQLRRQLGAAARRRVAEGFSSRVMTQAYCRIYDRQLRTAPAIVIERQA